MLNGYKAFDKHLRCKNQFYKVGKSYTISDTPVLCERGYHFCIRPLDVILYYSPGESRFATIQADEDNTVIPGEFTKHTWQFAEDSKCVSKTITIKKEISASELVKQHIALFNDKKPKRTFIRPSEVLHPDTDYIYLLGHPTSSALISQTRNTVLSTSSPEGAIYFAITLGFHSVSYTDHCGASVISVSAVSSAYADASYCHAMALGANSLAVCNEISSLAVITTSGSRAVVNGGWSIAVNTSKNHNECVELNGNNCVGVSLGGSAIVTGDRCTVVFMDIQFDSANKLKYGTLLIVYASGNTSPFVLVAGIDVKPKENDIITGQDILEACEKIRKRKQKKGATANG